MRLPRTRHRRLRGWGVGLLVGLAALGGCGDDENGATAPERTPEFGYSGREAPEHWAELDPAWRACSAGERQSPVDLAEGTSRRLPRLGILYRPAELEITNNGHSLEAEYPSGSSLEIGRATYELRQFHFHAPSEHRLGGRSFPLEFHFVHESGDGDIAVLGMLVDEGRSNPAFAGLTRATPGREGDRVPVEGEVSARELLPDEAPSAPRWSYRGSLTTPPCSEAVRWEVLAEPIELSAAQIASYTAVYDANNRPVQPRNGRRLLVDR